MHPHQTIPILGVALPVDAAGRVDLSRVHRNGRTTGRSPSEWARTAQFTFFLKTLMGKTGLPVEELWVVVGTKKMARTWVHPEIAEAYLKELGFGAPTRAELAERVADLERRLADIELQILGWGEGLE